MVLRLRHSNLGWGSVVAEIAGIAQTPPHVLITCWSHCSDNRPNDPWASEQKVNIVSKAPVLCVIGLLFELAFMDLKLLPRAFFCVSMPLHFTDTVLS